MEDVESIVLILRLPFWSSSSLIWGFFEFGFFWNLAFWDLEFICVLEFVFWNLFVICFLSFGASLCRLSVVGPK